MKITFNIPDQIHGHEVGNAFVLEAKGSHLCEGNELLEIEGEVGVKVVLLLTPAGADSAQSYIAYEWNGASWGQVELPVFTFEKIALGEFAPLNESAKADLSFR
ncbi:MAG: hypothetical protein WEC39_00575 [Patescibacteria group bacterium]